jgi:formylglycine-generating enzyme required for sulfatase activity
MRKIIALVALLGFDADPTMSAALFDERAKKFAAGYDFLNQHKYEEARTAFETGLQQYPTNALAHFYLGEACWGLKAWGCAETHYGASLELAPKSSVAGLAKQRSRRAKVWRLLNEGEQVKDTLDLVNEQSLDEESRAFSRQIKDKIEDEQPQSQEKPQSVPLADRSMTVVPAGEFVMGSVTGDPDEQPVRRVYLDAFFMDRYQVSVGQYAKFLEATSQAAPPDWSIMNKSRHQNRPVVNVDWADANAYCTWAGKRLPTEAEWEKAARGTDGRTYPWGNELPTGFRANSKKEKWSNHWVLMPVGMYEKGKSPYGLYDMAGNVWEWVSDWYAPDYYASSPSQNPTGPPTGESKVIRGGSWGSGPKDLRSADRDTHVPSARGLGTGFRCAKNP